MELGGKAPVIVFMMRILKQWSKVYVHLAITMLTGLYCGLSDLRAKRHLRYAVEKLGAAVATLKSGAPDDESRSLDL